MASLCERLRRDWHQIDAEYQALDADQEGASELRERAFAVFQALMAANANSIDDCIAKIDILAQEAFVEPAGDPMELAVRSGWATISQALERLRFMFSAQNSVSMTKQ